MRPLHAIRDCTILLLALCAFGGPSFAQTNFQKAYNIIGRGCFGNSVGQTSDGGYIVVGDAAYTTATQRDIYLVKTNASGDTLWTRTIGGASDETALSVKQTPDGGYIIAGATTLTGLSDLYLVKTNDHGIVIWSKTYGGTAWDEGWDGCPTSDGGYIIVGEAMSYGIGGDVYLVKTNSLGDVSWTTHYGGPKGEYGCSVQQTSDGGYIVAGVTYSPGPDSCEVYLIKIGSSGDAAWARSYGRPGYNFGYSVQQTSDGGYIVAGRTSLYMSSDYSDFYLLKTNSTGDTLWTKTFGGSKQDWGSSVQQTSDGGYIFAGSTRSFGATSGDVYLVKTNASGDTLWTRTFGGSNTEYGSSVRQTSDGGYIIAGTTASFGPGGACVYLIKTDSKGLLTSAPHEPNVLPADFTLLQNFPNPFNPRTTIRYAVPEKNLVTLTVFNAQGQEVARLVNGEVEAGYHDVVFNASGLASGVYFYRLQAAGVVQTRKLCLIK